MSSRIISLVAVAALGASATVLAQTPTATDLTFSATGTDCKDVKWSPQTLAQYPNIASACQRVVQRDGKYFVVFSGTVHSVGRYGRTLSVAFDDGDEVTLSPPAGMKFDIEGTMTRPRDIIPRQRLTFYVPQDRFVAAEPEEGENVTAAITRWEPQPIANTAHTAMAAPEELPRTGTELGLLALGGLALMLTGAGATTLRYRRGAR